MTSIDINDEKVISIDKENKTSENFKKEKKNKKKKSKNRCNFEGCKKKLSIIDKAIVCKCKKVFCAKHRVTVKHNCEIIINKDNFAKNKGLGVGEYKKLIKI